MKKLVVIMAMVVVAVFCSNATTFADGGDNGASTKVVKKAPADPGPNPAGELTAEEAAKTIRVGTIIVNKVVSGEQNIHKQTVHKQRVRKQYVKKQYVRESHVKKQFVDKQEVKTQHVETSNIDTANIKTANIETANIENAYVNNLYATHFQSGGRTNTYGASSERRYSGSGNCPSGDCEPGRYVPNTTRWSEIEGVIDLSCASDSNKPLGSCASKIWVPGRDVPAGPAGSARVQVVVYNGDPDRVKFAEAVRRAKTLLGHASKYNGPVAERYGKTCEYQLH